MDPLEGEKEKSRNSRRGLLYRFMISYAMCKIVYASYSIVERYQTFI